MLCSLFPHIRKWLQCSPRPMLGGQASAVFLLPSAAQGLTAAEKGQLHVLPGRHPSPTRVLQHLRAHGPARGWPYGNYGRAEAVRALTHAHSVCGPRHRCAGLSVAETEELRIAVAKDGVKRWRPWPEQQSSEGSRGPGRVGIGYP